MVSIKILDTFQETKEQLFEKSFGSTLLTNIEICAAIFLIFPFLKRLFPSIFSSQNHLPQQSGKIYTPWFIDVFQQPLSIFSTRGNLTTIFVVFQIMLLSLNFFIALISVTILIPTYYNGTDASQSPNYLTIWSKLTLSHLETGSFMNFIPIMCIILFTIYIMVFYSEFQLIYIIFRQKCVKRNIPQNYVVQLLNIPSHINCTQELQYLLEPIKTGIKTIIPVPKRSFDLSKLNTQINLLKNKQETLKIYIQRCQALFVYNIARVKSYTLQVIQTDNIKLQNKYNKYIVNSKNQAEKMKKIIQFKLKDFENTIIQLKTIKFQIYKIQFEDKLNVNHIYNVTTLPPELPSIIQPTFYYVEREQNDINLKYKDEFVEQQFLYDNNQLIFKRISCISEQNIQESIGSSAFIICESQAIAAEKQTTLISVNQKLPQACNAPNPQEILWENINVSYNKKIIKRIISFVMSICLLIFYIIIQYEILARVKQNQIDHVIFFDLLCSNRCSNYQISGSLHCDVCDKITIMLGTYLPSFVNCIFMSFLPGLIEKIVKLMSLNSISKNINMKFKILFIFLILIMGIIQLILPDLISAHGYIDFELLKDFNVEQIINNIGINVTNQQFTFINYIINKYFAFPALNLLNFQGIYNWIISKCKNQSSLESNVENRFISFDFSKQLAYSSHMFVIGLIFAINAPVTNLIILITYLMMVITDRYSLLYQNIPDITSDLSAQSNLLFNVIGTLFIGLILMLVAISCHYYVLKDVISTIGVITCIICLVLSLLYKIVIDNRYKRALNEMARGNNLLIHNLQINAFNTKQINKFDLNNTQNASQLNDLLNIQNEYKMNLLDNLLKFVYADLTDLPISLVQMKGMNLQNNERHCRVLNKNQIQIAQIDPKDEVNIIASYTHPALLQAAKID
ncbi:Transmembrane_domain-containing protein [Hexamita inflata]|uniref:Transmembrane domain-containing protein n=1 Tax=Hexamita inflata TaxID=28002 RepID=A0AA86R7E0_9EUKA|nr:Transmembrane domain-containing protein [Hexamita inflata]